MKNLLLFTSFVIFLSLSASSQQIENPGFELWENAGTVKDEPVDWSTIKTCDDPNIAAVAPVTFDISTDAHTGNYSLRLDNVKAFGLVATGAICNGRFHAEFDLSASYSFTDSTNAQWHTRITDRPDSLVGWFKYFPNENDKAQFKLILHEDECKLPENGTFENWIGMAVYQTEPGVTYDNWTRFSVPFDYYSDDAPQFLLCVLNSGDSTSAVEGSYLLADDLELIYKNAGIEDHSLVRNFLQVSGRDLSISTLQEHEYIGNWFRIVDLGGRTIYKEVLTGSTIKTLPGNIPPGMYMAVLESDKNRYVQKFYLGQ